MQNNKKYIVEILKSCILGDRKAQKLMFKIFYNKSMIIAMRYAKDNNSAKDIVSDSFVKVFSKINTVNINDSLQNIEGWVCEIVVNTAIDYIIKSKNTFKIDVDNISMEDVDFKLNRLGNLSHSELITEIQNLTPIYRAVFNMYIFENMSHKDIGDRLGISEIESKSTLIKAKIIIKKRISELLLCEN